AYKESGGGLLGAVGQPLGDFGNNLLIVLALSIIANNILNVYIIDLFMQVIAMSFQRHLRMMWTLFAFGYYLFMDIPVCCYFIFAGIVYFFLRQVELDLTGR